jgi:hypothetical protein
MSFFPFVEYYFILIGNGSGSNVFKFEKFPFIVDSVFCFLLIYKRKRRRKLNKVFFYDIETRMFILMDESRSIGEKNKSSTLFV